MKPKDNTIKSFANLTFHAMPVPNTGCIATGRLVSGYSITVTGGNIGQAADGVNNYLVEVIDTYNKPEPRIVTKKNMEQEELCLLIEHHYKNRFRNYRRRR